MEDTKITKDTVRKISDLALIELTDDEIERYQKEITSFLEYADKIMEVDVADIEKGRNIDFKNRFREDKPGNNLEQEDALRNRKDDSRNGYFKIKSVF